MQKLYYVLYLFWFHIKARHTKIRTKIIIMPNETACPTFTRYVSHIISYLKIPFFCVRHPCIFIKSVAIERNYMIRAFCFGISLFVKSSQLKAQ